jgi:hypothetical protein
MSDFNCANDLASQLVFGRWYQSNEPCPKIEKLVFCRGEYFQGEDQVVVTATELESHQEWAAVASRIQALLGQGYQYTTLPCEYCGATELEDVLHCDECGEAVPHGHEHPGIDEDGDDVTYCDSCQPAHDPSKYDGVPLEEL